jgi:hypothetical protein
MKSKLKLLLEDVSDCGVVLNTLLGFIVDHLSAGFSLIEVEDGSGLLFVELHSIFDDALFIIISNNKFNITSVTLSMVFLR